MAASLRICLSSDDFLPAATGVGVHLGLVAPELARRGHQVSVVTSRRSGQPAEDTWQGVRVLRMPTLKVYGFYQALPSAATLRALLRRERPDLVHHHYPGLMMRRFVAEATAQGVPQLSTYHVGAEVITHPWPMRPLRGWVQREMVRAANACRLVISPSARLIPQLAALGVTAPMRHLTNPVALEAAEGVVPAARPAGYVVLYAGRLGPEKNIGLLLRAFARLRERVPDAALWICGRGPEEGALRRLAGELGIAAQVHFLGFLDHPTLARHYAACDVFVLPSLQEVQPLVAMEAMWFGRPVILTQALAAAEELVSPGVNGFIVDPGDPAPLAARLVELQADAALREAMGRECQARSQAFRPDAMVDALEQSYHDVLR